MDTSVVAHYKAMPNEELFPIGERALGDVADDIIALTRFATVSVPPDTCHGVPELREFVARNSKYSLRTSSVA